MRAHRLIHAAPLHMGLIHERRRSLDLSAPRTHRSHIPGTWRGETCAHRAPPALRRSHLGDHRLGDSHLGDHLSTRAPIQTRSAVWRWPKPHAIAAPSPSRPLSTGTRTHVRARTHTRAVSLALFPAFPAPRNSTSVPAYAVARSRGNAHKHRPASKMVHSTRALMGRSDGAETEEARGCDLDSGLAVGERAGDRPRRLHWRRRRQPARGRRLDHVA